MSESLQPRRWSAPKPNNRVSTLGRAHATTTEASGSPGHVLILSPDVLGTPGGIARHTGTLVRAIDDGHWSVDLLVLHDPAPAPRRGSSLPGAVSYRACGGSRWRFAAAALAGSLRRPDVVIVSHSGFVHLGWVAARLAGARLLAFCHGIESWSPLHPVRRSALRRADAVACVSAFTATRASHANGVRPDRIRVVHGCVDPSLSPHTVSASAGERPSLISVGRLSSFDLADKGYGRVLEALPSLLDEIPDLLYHVVGDGDARGQLLTQAQRLGVSHAVRFHGPVSDGQLASLYASATIFVLPARSEGFGLSFAEAMAHGLPVIAGTGNAAGEVILDAETGYLIDPESRGALVTAVTRLIVDRELHARMREAARQRAWSRFSYSIFRDRVLAILSDLTEPTGAGITRA